MREPATSYIPPYTLRQLYHERRYYVESYAEARAIAATRSGPDDEPWGMTDATGVDVPSAEWKLYDGDLIVRGGKLLIYSRLHGEADTGLPAMSYLVPGTMESPAMWLTPRMVEE